MKTLTRSVTQAKGKWRVKSRSAARTTSGEDCTSWRQKHDMFLEKCGREGQNTRDGFLQEDGSVQKSTTRCCQENGLQRFQKMVGHEQERRFQATLSQQTRWLRGEVQKTRPPFGDSAVGDVKAFVFHVCKKSDPSPPCRRTSTRLHEDRSSSIIPQQDLEPGEEECLGQLHLCL